MLVIFFPRLDFISSVVFACSPNLTWRDLQHLTVLTSKRNKLHDEVHQWRRNGVGLEFNHLFGYGVLDAGGMVKLAREWKTVPERFHCVAGSVQEIQWVQRTHQKNNHCDRTVTLLQPFHCSSPTVIFPYEEDVGDKCRAWFNGSLDPSEIDSFSHLLKWPPQLPVQRSV